MIQTVSDFNSETVPIVMASFVSLFMPTKIVYELGLPIKEFLFGQMIGNTQGEYH